MLDVDFVGVIHYWLWYHTRAEGFTYVLASMGSLRLLLDLLASVLGS
jgi:hypothetical protein